MAHHELTDPSGDAVVWDPYDWEQQDDPYPTWAWMRERAPVYRNDERGFWALSRHADVQAAVVDWRRFCSGQGVALGSTVANTTIIDMDPPRHDELRGLISRAFTPRRVAELEGPVRAQCRDLLAAVDPTATVDLVDVYTNEIPMAVITQLLDVPAADRPLYRRWIDAYLHRAPGRTGTTPEGEAAFGAAIDHLGALIADRRAHPGPDLLSALIASEEDGRRITDEELLRFAFLLLIAGYETTTKLIGTAAYWLWRNPDQRRAVAADPELLPGAVEEVLRYDGPTPFMARTLTEDVTLHDVTMPAGDPVLLLFGSANRDPDRFPDPDRFDVTREPGGHLALGHGIHFCLGAAIARLEGRVAVGELLAAFPDYDVDPAGLVRARTDNNRGFAVVPVTLQP